MRNLSFALPFALLVACGGGGSDAPDANPLGQDCQPGDPCGNAGLTCVENTCTNACASSADCRNGTECRGVDGVYSCVRVTWSDDAGKYGTNCALHGNADCAAGYACVAIRDSDPYAYCTTACSSDRQCPGNYYCGDQGDGTLKCLRRSLCSPCGIDEECVTPIFPDGKCDADETGTKYCTKGCDPTGETCPPVFECVGTGGDAFCQHKSGSCAGDGSMCAPCFKDEDCAGTTGSRCVRLYFSGETFCSPPCSAGCPTGSVCMGTSCVPDNADLTCDTWAF